MPGYIYYMLYAQQGIFLSTHCLILVCDFDIGCIVKRYFPAQEQVKC